MYPPPPPPHGTRMDLASFVGINVVCEERLELHDGAIVHQPLDGFRHSTIATRLSRALGDRLEGRSCQAFGGSLSVGNAKQIDCLHPDATILRGLPSFHPKDDEQTVVVNPLIVFEVISDETEAIDRGFKSKRYRGTDSVEECFILLQDRPEVESLHRQPDG